MSESTSRPMRRKDRELTAEEAWEIVRHTDHAVLACCDSSGTPYAVPVTPVCFEGAIYFHGTVDPEGRRNVNLTQNPRVSLCFIGRGETAADEIPASFTVNYASAIVEGTASQITDPAEKCRILKAIAGRHVPEAGPEAIRMHATQGEAAVSIWKIAVDSITGKARNKLGYFNRIHRPV